jgi:hypothetical protein
MQATVSQTGYGARLLTALLHGGLGLSEAEAIMNLGDPDNPLLPAGRSRELLRLHLARIEEAAIEGESIGQSRFTYSLEHGLERLGTVGETTAV